MKDDKFSGLTEKRAKALLKKLVKKLDEQDLDDFFGSEGWRHFLDFEDEGI